MLEASYGWDNEGKLSAVAYPNGGKTYTYTYDTMARPVKLRDNTGIDWAKDGLYSTAGELTRIKYTSDGTSANYHTVGLAVAAAHRNDARKIHRTRPFRGKMLL